MMSAYEENPEENPEGNGAMLKVAFYGDDFTGATDNAAQYHRHGLKTLLFFACPDAATLRAALARHDVIGVAGTARSLATPDMAGELRPVLERFAAHKTRIVQYKCCSTFDSSPAIGSLGEAARLMRARWPGSFVPVLAATPEFGRYTLFGHHFARFGSDVYRLDRHPTMSRHPSTPMSESSLHAILHTQGFDVARHVDVRELDAHADNPRALADALQPCDAAIFDGLTHAQTMSAAAAIWRIAQHRPVTAIAAQGLAHALGDHLRRSGEIDTPPPAHRLTPTDRLLVLSGSCSPQSAAQIAWAGNVGFHLLRLSPRAILEDDETERRALEREIIHHLRDGRSVVAYTASGPDDPAIAAINARLGPRANPAELAERVGHLCARLARHAIAQTGLRRLAVAGGDSSSFTMRNLGAHALEIHASHFAQNAHVGRLHAADATIDGVEVLLKGGQVGTDDLYGLMLAGFDAS